MNTRGAPLGHERASPYVCGSGGQRQGWRARLRSLPLRASHLPAAHRRLPPSAPTAKAPRPGSRQWSRLRSELCPSRHGPSPGPAKRLVAFHTLSSLFLVYFGKTAAGRWARHRVGEGGVWRSGIRHHLPAEGSTPRTSSKLMRAAEPAPERRACGVARRPGILAHEVLNSGAHQSSKSAVAADRACGIAHTDRHSRNLRAAPATDLHMGDARDEAQARLTVGGRVPPAGRRPPNPQGWPWLPVEPVDRPSIGASDALDLEPGKRSFLDHPATNSWQRFSTNDTSSK